MKFENALLIVVMVMVKLWFLMLLVSFLILVEVWCWVLKMMRCF